MGQRRKIGVEVNQGKAIHVQNGEKKDNRRRPWRGAGGTRGNNAGKEWKVSPKKNGGFGKEGRGGKLERLQFDSHEKTKCLRCRNELGTPRGQKRNSTQALWEGKKA